MRIAIGYGGWVAVDGIGMPGPVYVRVAPSTGGRLQIHELYIDQSRTDDTIDQRLVRTLPLVQIEALINDTVSDDMAYRMSQPAPDLSLLAAHYSKYFNQWDPSTRDWVELSFQSQAPDALTAHGFKAPPRPRAHPRNWRSTQDADFRLARDAASSGLTDDFLRDVAKAYAAAVARGERPNRALAEQTGHAVKSAQRWVYTARQRGIMPRGSKGRVG